MRGRSEGVSDGITGGSFRLRKGQPNVSAIPLAEPEIAKRDVAPFTLAPHSSNFVEQTRQPGAANAKKMGNENRTHIVPARAGVCGVPVGLVSTHGRRTPATGVPLRLARWRRTVSHGGGRMPNAA